MELFFQWWVLLSNSLLIFLVIIFLNEKIKVAYTPLSFFIVLFGFLFVFWGGFFSKEISYPQYAIIGIYSIRCLVTLFRVNKGESSTIVTPLQLIYPVTILLILGFNHFFSFIG